MVVCMYLPCIEGSEPMKERQCLQYFSHSSIGVVYVCVCVCVCVCVWGGGGGGEKGEVGKEKGEKEMV